ncbi:hypothetical protein MMC21_003274 [Puttea exsequens]|nr:hypothetical protein [Puttea exsequens]
MPISKKDRVSLPLLLDSSPYNKNQTHLLSQTRREQKKADEAGIRTPKKPNGNPVKPETSKLKCCECFQMIDEKNTKVLEVHAETHAPKRDKQYCFPTAFKAA